MQNEATSTTNQDDSCSGQGCLEEHYDPDSDWIVACEAPNEFWGNTFEICSEECGHSCYYQRVLVPETERAHLEDLRLEASECVFDGVSCA